MTEPKLVRVRQNGDTGPVVEVSAAFAQAVGLTPIDSPKKESPKPSARRRRATKPSRPADSAAVTDGSDTAATEPTPEEASK